jgi:phage tail-like protein
MTDYGSEQSSTWPLPKFYFRVDIGDQKNISFQEVTGLDTETQMTEYRGANDPAFSTVKRPGIKKTGNVTRKGILTKDDGFVKWYDQIRSNTIKTMPVIIRLCDERGNPTMVWTLTNARPTKILGTDLKTDEKQVALETLEVAHEGFTIANLEPPQHYQP